MNSSSACAGWGLAPSPPATNTRKPASVVPSAVFTRDRDDTDVVEHRLTAVGRAAGEVDLELAGKALRIRVSQEQLRGRVGPRRDVDLLERARTGEVASDDVAHRVAARLAARQPDRSEQAQDLRRLLERDEMELHVLPGREVAPATRVRLADVAEHLELLRRDAAVRDLDPHHLVAAALALPVDAVVQPEDAEDVLVDPAVEVLGEGVFVGVELFGYCRLERPGLELSDIYRHRSCLSGMCLSGEAGRRGEGASGVRARQRAAVSAGRQSSSRTSCDVRPMATLAAPRVRRTERRITERRISRRLLTKTML